ncbi:CusA/CzcA family heavy metal efflux RND transporter [Carboxylicivirga mesophila]|uniref:CusA/CzcA family heavy metal efflux RND transporter n=1 Tax=Carboxylicivirga mesophila TaxID=1166478 RepID=A0ABS5KDM4_9BACT|nr:CusA/CzcA family heavy metal efflux RND transporter [Carboxylicivirga mesophila]MBS2212626.1 CusA/CzcA family heavy metal efflux RND transporter [Carboxylicivirga mesophila]
MINSILSFSIKNKLLIGLMTIALIFGGLYSMTQIPLDATPDITNNQVQVITVAPNLSTEDIEQFVTYQVELSMSNLPSVTEIRSVSRFGLSVVTIVFEDEMGTYLPRQLVGEALDEVQEKIPAGFGTPAMSPISTGLGEIYQYALEVEPGYEDQYNNMELRSIQDWIVKRQMAMLSGVVEINSFGGETKQYEVAIEPNQLKSMNVTMTEVFKALQDNNQNTGGAYIEKNNQINYIRGEGLARSVKDIENMVIKSVNNRPVYIRDVAKVQFGSAVRYGAFTRNGKGEAVGGIVMMLKGENSNKVIANVKERIEQIQKSLPEGVRIVPFLDRSEMIKSTTSTVAENLSLGALIVIFVLVLILGNMRGGLIVATVIPLSLLFAFIMMHIFDVWANLMSLGAIDFGILIDGAVILIEGMIFYLGDKTYIGRKLTQLDKDKIAFKISSGMMNSVFFGQIIIMIVFIPLLALQGIEGKMFKPMALTFGFAVIGVTFLCLTYVPMMMALFLKPPKKEKQTFGDKFIRRLENTYQPMLEWTLNNTKKVMLGVSGLFIVSAILFSNMGGEFVPQLDEGNLAMHILLKPGTDLTNVVEKSTAVEKLLVDQFPDEIESIQTRIGVADIPTDPMPIDIGDCFIILKDKDNWTAAGSKEELLELFKETVSVIPGINYEFSQPVEMRFNELLTGIREDLAIKLYGEDLEILAQKAAEIEKLVANINGVGDIRTEATKGLPQITVNYNREQLAYYGANISDLNTIIKTAFNGSAAGVVYEGEKRFDLVVRLNQDNRRDIEDVKTLFIPLPNGQQIPLQELADVDYQPGPMQISRDNTNRSTYVGINVRGRDVKTLVQEIEEKLDAQLDLPAGYYIRYGGAFENLERASKRLMIVVPIALALIFVMLFMALKSIPHTLLVYMAIPLSAMGGIISLYIRDMPFSISAGVGFIVIFGVGVMDGLVLIGSFKEQKENGITSLRDIIVKGATRRVRPVFLLASTDILGFIPMALSTSAGAEVQRPLATVVIGGLFTETLLTLFIVPLLYQWLEGRKEKKQTTKNLKTPISLGIGLCLLTFGFSPAIAQDGGNTSLSLSEAITIAKENYPTLKAAELQVKQNKSLKGSAFNLGNTSFSMGKEEVGSNAPGVANRLVVEQTDIDILGIAAKRKLQQANVNVAVAEVNLTEDNLELQVSNAFNTLLYFVHTRGLYQQIDKIYRDFVKAAELRYKTEQSSKLEYLAATTKYNELQVKIQQIEGELMAAHRKLNQFLLLPNEFEVADANNEPLNIDILNTESNAQLLLAREQLERAERIWKQEKAAMLPKFNLAYSNQSVDGVSGYYGYSAGISIPLFNGQNAKTKAARTGVLIEEQKQLSAQLEIKSLLAQRMAQYESAAKVQNYYQSEALPLADEQMKATTLAYQLGEIDYTELIQNMETILNTKQMYIDANLNYRNLKAELIYLTGSN